MDNPIFSEELERFLRYLQFKQECMQHQFENPICFDRELAVKSRDTLLKQQEQKVEQLKRVMPKVKKTKWQNKPKVTHKLDGTLSVAGNNWHKACKENGVNPAITKEERLKVFSHWEDPNPNSSDQVKDWLHSMGWEPCTYKYVRDKDTGDERRVEQVRKNGELTPSVLRLIEVAPEVEILEGLTIIQHRLSIFQGFIECAIEVDGKYYLRAEVGGLTNTLRFKHKKPLVNLPGVDKPWGTEVRSCLIAPEGEVFIGADLSSLESTTKAHFIYPHDPEFAVDLTNPQFDEHLDLAVQKGEVSKEDYDYYTQNEESDNPRWKGLSKTRKAYKPVNYGGVYGIGKAKLARETGWSQKVAADMLEQYWKRNWAVKEVAKEQFTKTVGNYTWLKNPLSDFYYELRYDKDRFSTLNQGTGVFIFDSWLVRARTKGYNGSGQFHDETLASVKDQTQQSEALKYGIERLNKDLTLNVQFGVDIKTGKNYAEVH